MEINDIQEAMLDLRQELQRNYRKNPDNVFTTGVEGYWSNLDKDESRHLADISEKMGARSAVSAYYPHLFNVIFSLKRQGGLELLDISGHEKCIDYGCMWGALTIPLAKRCSYVLGIDQTMNSLRFLNMRIKEEGLCNVDLLCGSLNEYKNFNNKFDIAIVNGVLEWLPEEGDVELKNYYGKHKPKRYAGKPRDRQLSFLKRVHQDLSNDGKVYLAIENRFDFKMFFGAREPHSNLFFASILPRRMANWLSNVKLGRPYMNWTYSFRGVKDLLRDAGFSKVELYMCFPDYRYPERIIPYGGSLKNFTPTISLKNEKGQKSNKRCLARLGEFLFFRILRLKFFAPSIIAIGHK